MPRLLSKLFAAGSDKELKRFQKIVARVNELESRYRAMDDDQIAAETPRFRDRLAKGETLDQIMPEAFAAVREMSRRVLGMRHFDVQVMGAIALHEGMIAEMKTGEGKTLVATLAVYLNALEGKGVHVVTVNDYLARRDAEWMGRLYKAMGLTVGLLQNGTPNAARIDAYRADITYGTNSEFGFDYLRDNMVRNAGHRVQRPLHYAIVDEVDSILIDEARTPLIISGSSRESNQVYKDFAAAVRGLVRDVDFEMDEAKHTINTTEKGLVRIERFLKGRGYENGIYGDQARAGELVNHLQQALKAEYLFHRDQQYAIIGGEVKIVDEFTGRIMEGRRYSEGLHQAIEAKENMTPREENVTHATITLQNFFRLYDRLAGMTGTAMTEDSEFRQIYNLPVQAIPPNKPSRRVDREDVIYRTRDEKYKAIVRTVRECYEQGRPVLVGTVSIESSELLSRMLGREGIRHNTLNAKNHELEADIIAEAGSEGAVTIATNMAGRGTDIILGGNLEKMLEKSFPEAYHKEFSEATPEEREEALAAAREDWSERYEHVKAMGGLLVLGTERHEARRIDNQLRGRCGRQGDPGETQFFLSLEDDLMRLFGADKMERINSMMERVGMPADEPIQAKMVSRAIEGAQHKVEEINFSMRKNVLEYDDVMNEQRRAIYAERNRVLDAQDLDGLVESAIEKTADGAVDQCCPEGSKPAEWDFARLANILRDITGVLEVPDLSDASSPRELSDRVQGFLKPIVDAKRLEFGPDIMKFLTQQIMLSVIDARWVTYLQEMDYLRTGIGLRGFGQRDPLVEYKAEAYRGFQALTLALYGDFLKTILHYRIVVQAPPEEPPAEAEERFQGATYSGPTEVDSDQGPTRPMPAPQPQRQPALVASGGGAPQQAQRPRPYRKSESGDPYAGVGRNEPCPCGSGKKFKNCHGRRR